MLEAEREIEKLTAALEESRQQPPSRAEMELKMKLELECKILAGAESKAFLVDLAKLVERMEKASGVSLGKKAAKVAEPEEEEEPETEAAAETEEEEETDFAPKKKSAKKAKAAAFEEEEEAEEPAETEGSEEEEEESFAAPAKKTKAKKITIDDCNDACKAKASSIGGKDGIKAVRALLKKHFKTESISELKPEQYAACVALMEV